MCGRYNDIINESCDHYVIGLLCDACLEAYIRTYIQNQLRNQYICTWSVNIRITRVNNICFQYVAISDDISTHADFQVDGYHGC